MSKVIVIGSGPAGVLAAIALKRQGLEPTLYDKVEPLAALQESVRTGEPPNIQFGEVGGSVSLYGNGLRALRNLGLLEGVEELRDLNGLDEMNFMLMNGSDRIVRNLRTTKPGEIPPFVVLRSAFHAVLMKAANVLGIRSSVKRPFIETTKAMFMYALTRVCFRSFSGKKIKNLVQSDSGVTVEFEDGTITTGDLVIGADGIHSKTRKLIFENAPKPTCFGTGYLGVLDRQTNPDVPIVDFEHCMGLYMNPVEGHHVYFNRCGSTEGSFSVLDMNFDTINEDLDDWRPVTNLPRESETLGALVDSWGAPKSVGNCIRHAKRITPVNLYDLPDLPILYKNRVVLIGDAAHGTLPTYGQGLNQAIEDAATLGDLFGHFNKTLEQDYTTVFEIYNKVRIPRVHKCAALSRQTAARLRASSYFSMRIGRLFMRAIMTVFNAFQLNDDILYHDYRTDLVKAVPDIQFTS
ncbi:UNVERIFIED_CONTAM: hypothetical protein HDU68_009608 [Siphonaria sp. JEL0065]|nr:hypothetical protein HDU68_009608 [Siphonaria sp. JEL0065]